MLLPVQMAVRTPYQIGALPAYGFVNGLALDRTGTVCVAALGQVGLWVLAVTLGDPKSHLDWLKL